MKIVVVSDTHGNNGSILNIMKREPDAAMLLHCGDICADDSEIISRVSCPVHIVSGNMDFGSYFPNEKVIEVEGHRIFMCHGNRQYVKYGLQELIGAARDVEADIALFGHTHVSMVDILPDLWIMNPGSPVYPRNAKRLGTYGIIDIQKEKVNCYLKEY